MNPEISRRCPACGASIRERDALFCAECGKPLAPAEAPAEQSEPAEAASAGGVRSTGGDSSAKPDAAGERPAAARAGDSAETSKESNQSTIVVPTERVVSPETKSAAGKPPQNVPRRPHPRMDRTRETLHRASTAARGVIEDEVKRVEKIRHVSSVVIEEASYDPSLRFVLVALGLFILFLILLVVSKVMG